MNDIRFRHVIGIRLPNGKRCHLRPPNEAEHVEPKKRWPTSLYCGDTKSREAMLWAVRGPVVSIC